MDPTISMLSLRDFKHHISGTSSEFLQGYDILALSTVSPVFVWGLSVKVMARWLTLGLVLEGSQPVGNKHIPYLWTVSQNYQTGQFSIRLVGLLNWLVGLFSVKYLYL